MPKFRNERSYSGNLDGIGTYNDKPIEYSRLRGAIGSVAKQYYKHPETISYTAQLAYALAFNKATTQAEIDQINSKTSLLNDFNAEPMSGYKRSREEAAASDALFSNDSNAFRTPGNMVTGTPNRSAIQMGGSFGIQNQTFPTKLLNWKKYNRSAFQLEDFIMQKIKWMEILQPQYADSLSTATDKRGVVMSSSANYQRVWDGAVRLNDEGTDTLASTNAANLAGFKYFTTLDQTELESKFEKLRNTLNPARAFGEVINATMGQSHLPTMEVTNFVKTYDFTNVNNNNLKLEYWDMLCIKDCDYSPLQIWQRCVSTNDNQPVSWGYGVNDPSATTTPPYVAYKIRMGTAGNRPNKKNSQELFQHWHCMSKKVAIIPAGGSLKIQVAGNFHVSGDKIYKETVTGAGNSKFKYIQHVTRMGFFFMQGEDGIVKATSTATPKNIGWKVPTTSKIFCSISQVGYYKTIPRLKNYVQFVTNWYDDERKTDTTTVSNDPATAPAESANINLSTSAATIESVGQADNLLSS